MTQAETITAAFGDGQTFEAEGQNLVEILDAQAWKKHTWGGSFFSQNQTIYVLADETMIVVNDQFWDILSRRGDELIDSNGDVYVAVDQDGDPIWNKSYSDTYGGLS